MAAKINAKKFTVTFTNILNEAKSEMIKIPAEKVGCTIKNLDCGTKIVVTANDYDMLSTFIVEYNK